MLSCGFSVAEGACEAGMVEVRGEQPRDTEAIYEVSRASFATQAEADLVNALRAADALALSLVATEKGDVVGHVAFSPVEIRSDGGTFDAVGLAPLAVVPEYQRKGIGSELVERGLQRLDASGHAIVVVLGDPQYYRRFGFVPARMHRIRWEHDAPEEAFMVKELREGALEDVSGTARFRPEFDDV